MDSEQIKRKAVSGTIWKFLERFIAQGVSLIVSVIIARILTPSDYSVVSIVTIFFTFANVIISGGLNTALIQKKDADRLDYSTVLHVSVIVSVIFYIAFFFAAPWIAELYDQPVLVPIIRVMSLSLPITAVKSIWCAYISSNLQFKKFFFSTIGGTLVSAVVGIYMAVKGCGAWALVAQQMTNTTIDTLILIACTRIGIVLKVSWEKLKTLFRYGWKVFVSSLIAVIYTEISPLAIGLKFTKNDLSFYTKGKSFPSTITTATTNTLSAVLFPVLAKYQDDKEKILRYTRLYMRLSAFIVFPIMLGFFAVSDNFVSVVLTDKWLPASFYIKVFCISCMFDVVAVGNCETIKAIGRSDVFLVMEIIKKSCYFITLFIFIVFSSSPEVLASSYLICTVIQIAVNCVPNIKLIGYKFSDQIKDLLPGLIMACIMAAAVYFIGFVPMNKILLLCVQIAAGMVIYVLMSVITKNESFRYVINTVKSYIHK